MSPRNNLCLLNAFKNFLRTWSKFLVIKQVCSSTVYKFRMAERYTLVVVHDKPKMAR